MNISGITSSPNWRALPVGVQSILGTALPKHDLLFGVASARPGEPEIHQRIAIKLLEDPIVQETVKDFAVAEYQEKLATSLAQELMAELVSKLNISLAGDAAPVTPVPTEAGK